MSTICYQNIDEISSRYLETNYDMSPSIRSINGKRYICPHDWMQTDSATYLAPSTFKVNIHGDKNRPCFKCAGWIGSWGGGRSPKPITERLMWNENTPCPQGYTDNPIDCSNTATQTNWGGYPEPTQPSFPTNRWGQRIPEIDISPQPITQPTQPTPQSAQLTTQAPQPLGEELTDAELSCQGILSMGLPDPARSQMYDKCVRGEEGVITAGVDEGKISLLVVGIAVLAVIYMAGLQKNQQI